MHGRFRPSTRLLRHADFQCVYKQGRRHFGTHMTVFYLERDAHVGRPPSAGRTGPRIGFTVSRALGGAVHRNRIRRRMREAVRDSLLLLTAAVDVVINPKKSAETAELQVLRAEVARAFGAIQGKKKAAADERR
ncbi:MAG: ribonuclease P protein component [Stenotrophobium sp.]